ncbi:hypothetical protein FQR65_LT18514 [Abscondita terminalis]|nr:hypothetical protein FQR65_LT18514 [Abscondita terminalis]
MWFIVKGLNAVWSVVEIENMRVSDQRQREREQRRAAPAYKINGKHKRMKKAKEPRTTDRGGKPKAKTKNGKPKETRRDYDKATQEDNKEGKTPRREKANTQPKQSQNKGTRKKERRQPKNSEDDQTRTNEETTK